MYMVENINRNDDNSYLYVTQKKKKHLISLSDLQKVGSSRADFYTENVPAWNWNYL